MNHHYAVGDRVRFESNDWFVTGVRDNTIDGPQHLLLHRVGGGKFDTYPYWVSCSLVRLLIKGRPGVSRRA